MHTSSLAFPNMFSVTHNVVNVLEDDVSVVNRCRLLFLTDPTALYNSPEFGVGLKRYLWQYNTENTKAIIKDRMKDQLDQFEPSVIAEDTTFGDGLLDSTDRHIDNRTLEMTVGLRTTYGNIVSVDTNSMLGEVEK